MPTEYVDQFFNGALDDNTTYVMLEDIPRTSEFTQNGTGTGIIWDGNGFKIPVTKAGWLGLFPCPVNVWNLGIQSLDATAVNAGWFFQSTVGGSATNCYSTGDISGSGGGIFGYDSGGTATNCYSRGNIGNSGGGIFGSLSSGSATNCYSTGNIGNSGGGIFGSSASGSATNCYTTGTVGVLAGPIFGFGSAGIETLCGSSNTWIDFDANQWLTGFPGELGVGSVWDSLASPDTPYTLNPVTACFFGDAPVLTPSGYRRIDSLTIGDTVTTPTGEDVITQIYMRSTLAGTNDNPYSIPVGKYGATEHLLISPRHCIAVKGSMVEARKIGLTQVDKKGILSYYNLKLEGHSNMIVAGVEVESYVPR